MELASPLKRLAVQDKKDCAPVTLGTVQYFHEDLISTGKKQLEEMFGIQAKATSLDSGKLSVQL